MVMVVVVVTVAVIILVRLLVRLSVLLWLLLSLLSSSFFVYVVFREGQFTECHVCVCAGLLTYPSTGSLGGDTMFHIAAREPFSVWV